MISIYDLKPQFQKSLTPVLNLLVRLKVTANGLTLFTVFLSLGMGLLLWFKHSETWTLLLLPVFLFMRMALNALDGMLARNMGQSSELGEILNEIGDILSDAFLYLPLTLYFDRKLSLVLIFLFVYLGALTEFCGVLGKAMIHKRRYEGPLGKSDRAFLIGLFCIIMYFQPRVTGFSVLIFGFADFLLLFTCINRLGAILRK
jgi:CDP-diacylglycerol---glycerol-3-phosphate 3-phosphatidyltransferase